MKSRTGVNSRFSVVSAALQVSDFTSSLFKFVCERVPGYLSSFNLSNRMGSASYGQGSSQSGLLSAFYEHSVNSAHRFNFQLSLAFKKTATTCGKLTHNLW